MKVLNYGSLNIDYVYSLPHIVRPGETITSRGLEIFPGGKGLNQSVALARAGAEVYHAGLIGTDGEFLKEVCAESGVNVEYIRECQTRTGNAIIQVADNGQNSIVLFAGANRENDRCYINEVLAGFGKGDILLLQNEINLIDYLVEAAAAQGITIIMNPSPYDEQIENCDLSKIDTFIMNEVEGMQISGKEDPDEILQVMQKKYPGCKVVLTLGSDGAVYSDGEHIYRQGIIPVKVVDTTAAGDTFTGYYIAAIIEGLSVPASLKLAAQAAACTVSRKGAASSIPMKAEIMEILG